MLDVIGFCGLILLLLSLYNARVFERLAIYGIASNVCYIVAYYNDVNILLCNVAVMLLHINNMRMAGLLYKYYIKWCANWYNLKLYKPFK